MHMHLPCYCRATLNPFRKTWSCGVSFIWPHWFEKEEDQAWARICHAMELGSCFAASVFIHIRASKRTNWMFCVHQMQMTFWRQGTWEPGSQEDEPPAFQRRCWFALCKIKIHCLILQPYDHLQILSIDDHLLPLPHLENIEENIAAQN